MIHLFCISSITRQPQRVIHDPKHVSMYVQYITSQPRKDQHRLRTAQHTWHDLEDRVRRRSRPCERKNSPCGLMEVLASKLPPKPPNQVSNVVFPLVPHHHQNTTYSVHTMLRKVLPYNELSTKYQVRTERVTATVTVTAHSHNIIPTESFPHTYSKIRTRSN